MALALNNTIQYWRARVQHGPVGEFVRWWLGELHTLLPEPWQQRLQLSTRRVSLMSEGGNFLAETIRTSAGSPGQTPLNVIVPSIALRTG